MFRVVHRVNFLINDVILWGEMGKSEEKRNDGVCDIRSHIMNVLKFSISNKYGKWL